jgi:ElaB/YqjD/DUF883 family membrane-anchored ribosome-binding protein
MKSSLRPLLLLAFLSLMLVSCSKNTPKEVAKTWLTGFNHMDFEDAMKLSTQDTKNLLSSLEELTKGVSDSGKTEVKKIKVSIKDVKEEGDKAVVTYTSSDNPTEQKLNLVKENDKWLVQFTKTDLVGVMPKDEDVPVEETPAADSTTTTTDSVKK